MQIESQNYILENPQFGTASNASPTDTVVAQESEPVQNTELRSGIPLEYLVIVVGALLIAMVWIRRRRKPLL